MGYSPNTVDIRAALEIEVNGGFADVFHVVFFCQFRIEFKAAIVVREVQYAIFGKAAHALAHEFGMVALHIKDAVFFFGVGKSRWIAKDEVELTVTVGNPAHHVGFDQAVAVAELVGVEVAVCPVEIVL